MKIAVFEFDPHCHLLGVATQPLYCYKLDSVATFLLPLPIWVQII